MSKFIEAEIARTWNQYDWLMQEIMWTTMRINNFRLFKLAMTDMPAVSAFKQRVIKKFLPGKGIIADRAAVHELPLYNESVAADYIDLDQFSCVANTFAYIEAKSAAQEFSLAHVLDYIISDEYQEYERFIETSNIAQMFHLYQKRGYNIILYFVQNGCFYLSDVMQENAIPILVLNNHCWIGSLEWVK